MQSRWADNEARQFCDRYGAVWGEPLALRVYTSRLIGAEPDLVMHGGGNTSVKITKETLLGDRVEALCVKGSGWDLDSIEPQGFPALDLSYLRRLRTCSTRALPIPPWRPCCMRSCPRRSSTTRTRTRSSR